MKTILKKVVLLAAAMLILTAASSALAETAETPAKCDKASCEKCAERCAEVVKCVKACEAESGKSCKTVCSTEEGKHCQVVCTTAEGKECSVPVCEAGQQEGCKAKAKGAAVQSTKSCKEACEKTCTESKGDA